MAEDSTPPTDDPEIAALLDFEPVVRKCKRHDGWTADNQRRYILGLAETGNPEQAAHPLGRTMSGAYKVRTSAGGESFGEAWDKALALYLRRNPRPLPKGRPSRGEILAGSGRAWPAAPAPPPAPEPVDPEAAEREEEELFFSIIRKYLRKLGAERTARLEGRIVAADFYVRQLTYIEIVLDLGGRAHELLHDLRRGETLHLDIAATPMSVFLDQARRDLWAEKGEPDRPDRSPLGAHDDEVSLGEPTWYQPDRDGGDYNGWRRRQDAKAALRAEAQKAWEEKARADAEEWARRVADESGANETEARR